MSNCSKISKGKTLAKKLTVKYSNDLYKAIKFGNESGAVKSECLLNKVSNIKWLLDKASDGCSKPKLCSTSFVKEDEGYVNDVLQGVKNTYYTELWKGSIWNSNLEKLYSISSFSPEAYDPVCEGILGAGNEQCWINPSSHTRIRFWEWIDNVPTMVFESEDLFDITDRSQISIQYSALNKSYYLKVATLSGDVSSPTLIKITEDFATISSVTIQGTQSGGYPFQNALTEVVDKKNLIYVRRDANNIDYYSLVDLALIGTIDTTGFFYQAMTYDCKSNSLLLTGGGAANNALIHQVLFDCNNGTSGYTLTTTYDDANYINNNSMILSSGKLLVLTANLDPNPKLIFQVWSTCDPMHLKEEYVTDIELAISGNNFLNLLGLSKDDNGNIFVYVLDYNSTPQGYTSVIVFNSKYEFQYKQTLNDSPDFGVFEANFYPDFNNSFVDPKTGLTLVHSQNQNGAGGTSTYFLDHEVYSQIKPICLELTDDNVTTLISKLNALSKC